jgi:hypothetical protein
MDEPKIQDTAEAIPEAAPVAASTVTDTSAAEVPRANWQDSLRAKVAALPDIGARLAALRADRMAQFAACIAFGALIGAFAASDFARLPGRSNIVASNDLRSLTEAVTQMKADLATLRTANESINHTTGAQFAKLSERLERIDRGQAEPAAKLGKLTETVDRLDQRTAQLVAAKDATGSITATAKSAVAAAAVLPEPPRPAILDGWRLRNVYDGAALIQGRMGVIEVAPGDFLPGGGRVEGIRRQDGRWVVVTSKGLIVSMR